MYHPGSLSSEERDDGALSDGGDDMTPDEHAQLEAGLENVRVILGSEEQSGFTDSFIRESLWDCYFDVDKTVEWLAGMSCTRPLA